MNLNLMTILFLISSNYEHLNLTDYLVDMFGKNNDVVWSFLNMLWDFLEWLFPAGDMWTEVWERLFT